MNSNEDVYDDTSFLMLGENFLSLQSSHLFFEFMVGMAMEISFYVDLLNC